MFFFTKSNVFIQILLHLNGNVKSCAAHENVTFKASELFFLSKFLHFAMVQCKDLIFNYQFITVLFPIMKCDDSDLFKFD